MAKKKPTTRRPKPPYPAQHQEKPGIESELSPRPKYTGPEYKGSGKLRGKVAVITGGDSGIGRAVAVLFAREGARVAITYLSPEEPDAQETIQAIKKERQKGMAIEADLRSYDAAQSAIETVIDEYGQLDIVVNNAAFQQHQETIEELSIDQWNQTFKTNIYGYFYVVKAAMPYLSKGAVIINTGSVTGLEGSGGLLDYSATKGAIHTFTKSLAQQLLPRGIRVNAVAPGPVWTPLNPSDRPAEDVAHFGENVPMGRPAQPEEIAPAYVYFASEADSSYVTGEVLSLWGGKTTAG